MSAAADEQDYIPGTQVIRNLVDRSPANPYGTTDQGLLSRAETMFVSDRIDQLRSAPYPEAFTFSHMRAIHRHLFQDVYAWAGQPRRVSMSKLGTEYAEPAEMNQLLRDQYTALANANYLRGIPEQSVFAAQLAGFWAEINHGHAFREGNTRAQTVFFEQLAAQAGWKLDVARLSPQHPLSVYREFVQARFEHQRLRGSDDHQSQAASHALEAVLNALLTPDSSLDASRRRRSPQTGIQGRDRGERSGDRLGEHFARFPELRADSALPQEGDSAGVDYER